MNINRDKAPGIDRMNGHFYHQFWLTIGSAITTEVKLFFEMGLTPPQLNQTQICLIPKIDSPEDE